ncbi:MAG TPA: four helix bundle protein [Candidatus Acidoferrales bacterium]|nr:four helix bundle protein [Candidatus Acidoferrales bacterium]
MKEAGEAQEAKVAPEEKEPLPERKPIRRYDDLLVYRQALRLALEVSPLTRGFPRQEQYELGRQMRASSRSIAANIVEGWAKRHSAAEFKRHLQISIGESEETKFWLDLARAEDCVAREQCEPVQAEYAKLGMLLHNLWNAWKKLP